MYMYIARICVIIIYLTCIITFFVNAVTFPYLVNYMTVFDAHTYTIYRF